MLRKNSAAEPGETASGGELILSRYTALDKRHLQDVPLSTATFRLHQDDNVVVALRVHGTIPAGHKIATETISPGTPIIKYGQVIGIASKPVSAGADTALHEAVSTEPVASPRTFHGTRVCFYGLPRLRPDVDHRPGCLRC